MSADNVVKLETVRQQRAADERDLDMIAEVERRFAEALADVAELGGVTVDHLDALMREAWSIPAGGGVAKMRFEYPRTVWAMSRATQRRVIGRGRMQESDHRAATSLCAMLVAASGRWVLQGGPQGAVHPFPFARCSALPTPGARSAGPPLSPWRPGHPFQPRRKD